MPGTTYRAGALPRSPFLAAALLLLPSLGFSPARAGADLATREGPSMQEPLIIDYPSAGILDHATYRAGGRMGPRSGLLFGTLVGYKGRAQVGLTYGFQGLLETGPVTLNPSPGLLARVRVVDEGRLPAVAIGYDGQGYGRWDRTLERYRRKAPGFYLVVSRNYALLGDLSLIGGVNYTLENTDQDDLNVFGGLAKQVYKGFGALVEYDAALNDDLGRVYGRGRGYLDVALRLRILHLDLKFMVHDLLENNLTEPGAARELEVSYVGWW